MPDGSFPSFPTPVPVWEPRFPGWWRGLPGCPIIHSDRREPSLLAASFSQRALFSCFWNQTFALLKCPTTSRHVRSVRQVRLVERTYEDLTQLARICAGSAHIAKNRHAARELWRMALDYQYRAATLDSGKLPDIGPSPSWFKK